MGHYEKLQDLGQEQNSPTVFDNPKLDDVESTSSESTITLPKWAEPFHRQGNFFGANTVVSLLLSLIVVTSATIILLAWVVITLAQSHVPPVSPTNQPAPSVYEPPSTKSRISSCGTSSAEAISAGCHFDVFSFGWTPPECTDMELYKENVELLKQQTEGPSPFFIRAAAQAPSPYETMPLLTIEEYGLGIDATLWAMNDHQEVLGTWEHYLVGCSYAWQKVQRAATNNHPLESWSSSYRLATQCGPDLLNSRGRESNSIKRHLKAWYPKCGLEAEDLQLDIASTLLDGE